jgi:hypothetical protein
MRAQRPFRRSIALQFVTSHHGTQHKFPRPKFRISSGEQKFLQYGWTINLLSWLDSPWLVTDAIYGVPNN